MTRVCLIAFIAFAVAACTGGPKTVTELKPVLDPLSTDYADCLYEVSTHYALTIKSAPKVRQVAQDICKRKHRAIESALFNNDADEKEAREYLRGVNNGANTVIARAIRDARLSETQSH